MTGKALAEVLRRYGGGARPVNTYMRLKRSLSSRIQVNGIVQLSPIKLGKQR